MPRIYKEIKELQFKYMKPNNWEKQFVEKFSVNGGLPEQYLDVIDFIRQQIAKVEKMGYEKGYASIKMFPLLLLKRNPPISPKRIDRGDRKMGSKE